MSWCPKPHTDKMNTQKNNNNKKFADEDLFEVVVSLGELPYIKKTHDATPGIGNLIEDDSCPKN